MVTIENNEFEPQKQCEEITDSKKRHRKRAKKIIAYPKEWADSFGEKYYELQAKEEFETTECQESSCESEQVAFLTDEGKVTSPSQAADEIKGILKDIGVGNE